MTNADPNLTRDLRLMAYLDRQLPAEEARVLERELAQNPALQAELDEMKRAFGGLDRLFADVTETLEKRTPPDLQASLQAAQAQFKAAPPAAAHTAAATSATPAKVIALPAPASRGNRFSRVLTAAAAIAAVAMFMVFVLQSTPFLTLTPRAAATEPHHLPAALPVTVVPAQAQPVKPAAETLTREQLIALGLTPAQADQLLTDGVVLLTHAELGPWQSAGLEPALQLNGRQLPTYLTADAVYNLFLCQLAAAAERFDAAQAQDWQSWFRGCDSELQAMLRDPGFSAQWKPAAERLRAWIETGHALSQGQVDATSLSAAAQGEWKRLTTAGDGVESALLMRTVNYGWIRQHPAGQLRRWLGQIGTANVAEHDQAEITASLKLWWAVLQRKPALWSQYSQLALKIRAEEAGVPQGRDLVDLHAELATLCGDREQLRFVNLMAGRLQAAAKPIGILPPAVPFRNDLAAAMGSQHSFIDAVLVGSPDAAARFAGAQGRLKRLLAYRESQGPDSAIARWNRLFDPVEQPVAAWPYQTPAWREKSDRLVSAAWVGTPVRPMNLPAGIARGQGSLHYDCFEAAPDFYNRLKALCAEQAASLPANDAQQAALQALSEFLEKLTQASLDQLAGRPVAGIDLPAAALPAPAGSAGTVLPETTCRAALVIASADAGATDLIMGNDRLGVVLTLQPDGAGAVRVYAGAVSRPFEGLAPHGSAGPENAWARMIQDGTRNGFHYNGR